MAAIDTFRDAQRNTRRQRRDAIVMAGTHLAYANAYGRSPLADLHRGLADDHAASATMWAGVTLTYEAAEEAVQARLDDAAMEARELALAARFHHVMDLAPVAA